MKMITAPKPPSYRKWLMSTTCLPQMLWVLQYDWTADNAPPHEEFGGWD